ncbi:hypothetical protein [Candidimonas nitroreducens]|uniref:DUF2783 domain-containing protein n=1 Tax=Candidimonas nitroreducens TaxID=683354 RepID=A0A225MVV3_9BURK|nr:hypothetical protein [Candidimonas nitroreducens]OWT63701.1 hypothetical protein CEY11_05115 [Candidimonas nitroreducens]
MNDLDLDRVYTQLCKTLSAAGQEQAMDILARYALLSMLEIGDPERISALIERAALNEAPAAAA